MWHEFQSSMRGRLTDRPQFKSIPRGPRQTWVGETSVQSVSYKKTAGLRIFSRNKHGYATTRKLHPGRASVSPKFHDWGMIFATKRLWLCRKRWFTAVSGSRLRQSYHPFHFLFTSQTITHWDDKLLPALRNADPEEATTREEAAEPRDSARSLTTDTGHLTGHSQIEHLSLAGPSNVISIAQSDWSSGKFSVWYGAG